MVSFFELDITLLILFLIFTTLFLYFNKKNLKKEGSLILYKTQWGVRLINYIGKKYKKTLKVLSYVSIFLGFVLMISMIYLISESFYLYLATPISEVIRAPPVAPLIPYFPEIFGLESYFPSFPFIYFIIAILIVATVHEFSHGIFARRFGIKIKSTGFAFLKYFPAIFGAFVEQDDKDMNKKKKTEQLAVLSAGVFANLIIAILFYFILILYFSTAFTASGVIFNSYSYSAVNVSDIQKINGIDVSHLNYTQILNLELKNDSFSEIETKNKRYLASKNMLEIQKENSGVVALYDDSPAIKNNLGNTIISINGEKIDSIEKLSEELEKYKPEEAVIVEAISDGVSKKYEIILGKNPANESKAWLGVGFIGNSRENVVGKVLNNIPQYKNQNVYYTAKSIYSSFFRDLIWWIVIINLLVALFNMLPLGILDGGRFFYLTIWGITQNEKLAKRSFSVITYLILFFIFLLIIKWMFSFF